jgi:hypothetical protein
MQILPTQNYTFTWKPGTHGGFPATFVFFQFIHLLLFSGNISVSEQKGMN